MQFPPCRPICSPCPSSIACLSSHPLHAAWCFPTFRSSYSTLILEFQTAHSHAACPVWSKASYSPASHSKLLLKVSALLTPSRLKLSIPSLSAFCRAPQVSEQVIFYFQSGKSYWSHTEQNFSTVALISAAAHMCPKSGQARPRRNNALESAQAFAGRLAV